MAPSSSSFAVAVASMRRGARSKGGLGTVGVVVAALVAFVGAFSTDYTSAFAAAAKKPAAPAPPKRPGSGYILWGNTRRPSLVQERPNDKVTELGKALGAEWRALSDTQKGKWNTQAAELMAKYKNEVEAWISKNGPLPKQKKRGEPKVAKRAAGAYALYIKANAKKQMAEMGTTKVTDALTQLARRWKTMTDAQKAPFVKEAAQAKTAFEASRPPAAPKRPAGPYALYMKANAKKLMAELGTAKVTDMTPELGKRWKAMTDAQKAPYVKEAAQAKAAFDASKPPAPKVAKAKASTPKAKAKAKGKAKAKAKAKAPATKKTTKKA